VYTVGDIRESFLYVATVCKSRKDHFAYFSDIFLSCVLLFTRSAPQTREHLSPRALAKPPNVNDV
jgi:hypothetical protein